MTARTLSFVGPREVRVVEEPVPDPEPDEALVATRYSGISAGTESLVYRGEAPADLPVDESIDALDGRFEYPLRYGYAAVGTVAAVGADVNGEWLGRAVFAFHPHASHFCARPEDLHPLPDGCSPEAATLLPSVETALTLAMDARPVVGERAVVFGQGVVGLLATELLARHPLEALYAVEPLETRRARSREFGADASFAPGALDDLVDALDGPHAPGADLAVELSGDPPALDDAIAVAGYDGRVIVGSWYGDRRANLDLGGRFHRDRIELRSSQVSTIEPSLRGRWTSERRLALAWDRLEEIDAADLLTHRVPVEDAPDAYRLLDRDPGEALGIVLTY